MPEVSLKLIPGVNADFLRPAESAVRFSFSNEGRNGLNATSIAASNGTIASARLSHLNCGGWIQFGPRVSWPDCQTPKITRMADVFPLSHPLKVLNAIVRALGINVINYFSVLWGANESCRYKPVHADSVFGAIALKVDGWVPIDFSSRHQPWFMTHIPEVRDLVKVVPRLDRYGFPNFSIVSHLIDGPAFNVGGESA